VVAEDGAVYTCGEGLHGRLGLGGKQPQRRLTRVPQAVFAGSRVVIRGAESEMAVLAVAPGKELAVLGHGDGVSTFARRHCPRPVPRFSGPWNGKVRVT
jgi:alpha-tubulin suppressor-like RCC1 family protein